jgi:hypothetical protein
LQLRTPQLSTPSPKKTRPEKVPSVDYEPDVSKWSVKDVSLRSGEELVRGWWPEGKPLPGTHRKQDPGPLHTCGTRDRKAEPFLFKFWEPYGIEKFGPSTPVSYRHYFNGQINYAPDLTDQAAVLDGGGKLDGVQITPQGLTGAGTYTFKVKCPYRLTGALLQLYPARPGMRHFLGSWPATGRYSNLSRQSCNDFSGRSQQWPSGHGCRFRRKICGCSLSNGMSIPIRGCNDGWKSCG